VFNPGLNASTVTRLRRHRTSYQRRCTTSQLAAFKARCWQQRPAHERPHADPYWAYQLVPGASIHVGGTTTSSIPEPSTPGLLALGAGCAATRRKRTGPIRLPWIN
jgi:hypothetical protein